MATKQIGLGTIVKVDEDDSGSTFTTCTVVVDVSPPSRVRAGVDQTSLDDTLETEAPGIEQKSEFKFKQFWHPTDTQHASIDTLFDSKAQVIWNIVYPFATPITDQFEGWVSGLEPETITAGGMIMRTVTVKRMTAITRT